MVGFVAHGEIAGMPGFLVHRPFGPRLAPFQPDRAILVWKADTRTGIAAAWARPRLVRVFDHMGDHPSMFVTIGGRPCSAIPAIS